VFCGPPIFSTAYPRGVIEWVLFHQHHIGFDHFYFYSMLSNSQEFFRELEGFLDSRDFTIVDFNGAWQFPSWAKGQVAAQQDCLYRNRRRASWVAYGDFDEYLHVRYLPRSTPFATTSESTPRAAQLSPRGSYLFTMMCDGMLRQPNNDTLAVERVQYRAKEPFCSRPSADSDRRYCAGHVGYRECLVHTERTYIVETHRLLPAGYLGLAPPKTCVLNAYDVHNGHFRGLFRPEAECETIPQVLPPDVTRTTDFVVLAQEARKCRLLSRNSSACPPWEPL